jgi:malonyl-CoA O-methyltransferase
MIEQLKQIQTRFNKASKSYDDVAWVQKDAAEFLVDKLLKYQNFIPQTVLDVGTGTGYITELLLEKFPKSSFYLNDIATEMLEVCKAKFAKTQNIYYLPGDMLELDADLYDCVISNLALQWSTDLQYAINLLHSKSSNIFAFSTLLDGTFAEWSHIINQYQSTQILNYPKAEELISLCNKLKRNDQDFEYWLMDCPLSFENPVSFMRYLRSLGASAPGNLVHLSNLKKLIKAEAQSLTVTYKIFFGMFRRIS